MKKIIFSFILSFSFFNSLFANDFRVVARVNDRMVTKYDLDNYKKIFNVYFKSGKNTGSVSEKDILNSLIEDVLKSQAVEKEKIPFDKEEYGYFIESIESSGSMKKQLQNAGVDMSAYENVLKTNYLWAKLLDSKVKPMVSVNNSEVNDSIEYLTEKPLRTRYNISQITIYKNSNSDPKTLVDKLYNEIKNKNNFETIAEKFSQDGTKNKGFVGWVDEMDINKTIYEAIRSLPIGTISKPIYFGDDNSGYYMIVKLNDKKQERVARRDDIARVQYFIYNQKLNLEIKNYLDNLYNSAFIEIY